jgi:mannose-6-phosphate isomerase-like protein (cupin superfamily)
MKIKRYKISNNAIRSFTTKDKDYIFVRHVLKSKEKIKPHYHKKANEWIVIDGGKFTVRVGNEERYIEIRNKTLVISLPKNQPHSLLPKTKISYFVFRDRRDKIIYVKGDRK